MEVQRLSNFFVKIRNEKKITTSHISLYATLFSLWCDADFIDPVLITRRKIMEKARIRGVATFHKCIKDLSELGIIQYLPSYNPAVSSRVYFT